MTSPKVWKNVGHFKKGKEPGDELFDRLTTSLLNEYLKTLMDGLSAKVFRTYNASITLQVCVWAERDVERREEWAQ